MKILMLIIALVLAGAFVSCGGDRRVDDVLTAADSLVFVAPDSAVRLLDSLPLGRASADQLDLYALLSVKAREKADSPLCDNTADSLLSRSIAALDRAADHYRGRGDSLEVQTLFYRGVLLGYRGNYSEALVSLMEAADRAAGTGDHFYRAMSYREQADIYNRLYSMSKRAEMTELSAAYFLLAKRPLYALREKMMLAQSLIEINVLPHSFRVLNEIKADTMLISRPFKALYHRTVSEAYFASGEYHKSISHLDSVKLYSGRLSSIEYSNASRAAIALEQFDKAQNYLAEAKNTSVTKNDTANYLFSLAKLYSKERKYDEFHDVFLRYYAGEVKVNNELLTHPYTTLLVQHYENLSEESRRHYLTTRNFLFMSGAIIILLLILIATVIIMYRNRMRLRDERADVLLSDLMRFKQQVADMRNCPDKENNVHSHVSESSFHPYTPLINKLCNFAASVPENDKGYMLLGRNVSEEIGKLSAEDMYSELEKYVNATNNNLMARFKEQIVGLSDKKYFAALMIFAGFSNQFICAMLKYDSLSSARSIRNRLKKDVLLSSGADQTEFLAYF